MGKGSDGCRDEGDLQSGTHSGGVKHLNTNSSSRIMCLFVFHFYCLLKERHHGTCSRTIGDDDLLAQQLFSITFIGIH